MALRDKSFMSEECFKVNSETPSILIISEWSDNYFNKEIINIDNNLINIINNTKNINTIDNSI